MAKPFSIQSPEDIAKEYAGNKQKIAQAMQLGVVDPTAGVLAGMFIDRMRSAQMQEQAPQATVAQQVMGGAQPVPSATPSGGLGATPQAMPQPAPPMAPEMGMAPPQGEAPMGMAEGGIVGLDVPEGMFDEPSNGGFDDGYAGGGLVAFSDGGPALSSPSDYGAYIERMAQSLYPNLRVAGRGRTAARNAQVGGVANSYHLLDAARDLTTPSGMSKAEFIAQLKQTFGPEYDVIPSKGNSVHVEPGPALGKRVRGGTADKPLPERNIQAPEGRRASFEDQYAVAKKRFAGLPDAGLGELEAYYRGELAPEKKEKARKDDMWMALAQIGASMAGTSSPNFLQAAGQALAATLPGVAASKKERKAAERDARTGLREVLGLKRGEQKEVLEFAKDLQAIELGAETSELARKEAREAAAAARAHDKEMARIGQEYDLTKIREQGKVTNTQFEQLVAARRAQIIDRMSQGLPVTDPSGVAASTGGKRLSESEIATLANNWALFDLNRYRNTASASPTGLPSGAGAGGSGGGQQQVVDVPWQP